MPILARCFIGRPRPLAGNNNPINISLARTIVKVDVNHSGLWFPALNIEFHYAGDTVVYEWGFSSERERDAEFERILSI